MATGRLAATGALFAAMGILTPLQAFVLGPVFKNFDTVPSFFYNSLCAIYGIRVRFTQASAPIEKERTTWYVANHMAIADFAVLGGKLSGTFAGRGDLLEWPVISQMARAVRYIGINHASKKQAPEVYEANMQKARSKIISEFNNRNNVIMFPEGWTSDGKEVKMFRSGLIKLLFGAPAMGKTGEPVALTNKDVCVQPMAIHVVEVNGKNAVGNDELRNTYSLHGVPMLGYVWHRAKIRSTTVELTVFKPLNAADFANAEDMINEAHRLVREVVAPHQSEIKKAVVPGLD